MSFLWHLAALTVFGLNTLVDREASSCRDNAGFCLTAKGGAQVLFELSLGLLLMSLLASLAIAVPLSRRIRSAVLAGTVSAAASGGLIVVLLVGSIAAIVAR